MTMTAVVLTFNEERHLPDCLVSLKPLTADVLVLDSGSNDATVAIARAAGARVAIRAFDGYASQRNAALDLVSGSEWVFFLDADERLTSSGVEEISAAVRDASGSVAAFWVPRHNVVWRRTLRGGGWWPDHQCRVLRQGRARYDPDRQVHEVVQLDGESIYLTEPLVHLNYESRREFMLKQRAYTLRRVSEHGTVVPRRRAYLSRPLREFTRRIVHERGYRDGWTGLFLASVMALEEVRECRLLRLRAGAR